MDAVIKGLKDYAYENYSKGWDILIEAWTEDEIRSELEEADATTVEEAIAYYEKIVAPNFAKREDIRGTIW